MRRWCHPPWKASVERKLCFSFSIAVGQGLDFKNRKSRRSIKRRPGQDRVRAMAGNEDQYFSITARRNRSATVSQLSRDLHAATVNRVSRVTVSRQLHEKGLFARRPAVCVPLTSAPRWVCLAWCRGHRLWIKNQCGTVLFTNDSWFRLTTDSTYIHLERTTKPLPVQISSIISCGSCIAVRRDSNSYISLVIY